MDQRSQYIWELLREEQEKLRKKLRKGVWSVQEQGKIEDEKARQRLRQQAETRNVEIRTKLGESIISFFDVLKQLGWPPHGEMNLGEAKAIVEAAEASGVAAVADAVDRHFVRKYNSKGILRMLDSWRRKKALGERIEILEQAIQVHNYGCYYVSVPIILAQIEGIIADNTKHFGQMSGTKLIEYLEKEFKDKEQYSIENSYLNFCKLVLYKRFGHQQPISSKFSRHAIIHGGDIKYGTEAGSLKAILTFDTLQALLLGEMDQES
ncbi:MAG: hypothetical protein GX996_03280 [Firmicutes bacterium]|nr:hypothetical protein [Bacillota bacterium]